MMVSGQAAGPAAGQGACARRASGALLRAAALMVGLALMSHTASAREWHIGEGQEVSSPVLMTWSALRPGDVVWIHPGRYTGNPQVQDVAGSASKPIQIKAWNADRPPQLLDGITLRRASWLQLSGLDVTVTGWMDVPAYKNWAAVIIDQGSHDLTFSQSVVHDAMVGIELANTGRGIQLRDNQVLNNGYHGIAVNNAASTDAQRSVIAGNLVQGNGQHGIELESSFFLLEHNRVQNNGAETQVHTPVGGTSGIHLYSDGVGAGCSDNIVRYNHVSGQTDRTAADGNGLQADHFCDRNLFAFNVSWANDGAGLGLYAAAGNTVHSNTLRGNARDVDRPRRVPGVLMGELIITSAPRLHGRNTEDATRDNLIHDNLVVGTRANVPVVNIDWIVTDDPNTVGPNLLWSIVGAPLINRGGQLAYDATAADHLTGTSGYLAEAPAFVNILTPAQDGLRLSRKPSTNGVRIRPKVPDMLDQLPVDGASYFGAYYTAP
jgi:parallel beta-helix repeat protein